MNKFSGIGRILGLYGLPTLGTLAIGSWLLNRTRQPPSVAIDAKYGLRTDNPNITLSGNTVFHRPNEQSDIRQLIEESMKGDSAMKDKSSLHQKVQELCDCFATTDPLKEMSVITDDPDKETAALKWLALATLHGVTSNAEKISLTRTDDGNVYVTAEYRKTELPSPGLDVSEKIIDSLVGITHLEEGQGKTRLALGIRDSSLDMTVKMKSKDGQKKITLKFP